MSEDNVRYVKDYQAERAALETLKNNNADILRLKSDGGDGTSGGMDPWQTSVESRLGQLHTDNSELRSALDSRFLWLLSAFAAGFIVLGGMMIVGYLNLADKIDKVAAVVAALHH